MEHLAPINKGRPWVGIDFDKTLCHYEEWEGPLVFGEPIEQAVNTVKSLLEKGVTVKIFTARVSEQNLELRKKIVECLEQWCLTHIGQVLPITCVKDFNMLALIDDRAITAVPNEGIFIVPEHLRKYV